MPRHDDHFHMDFGLVLLSSYDDDKHLELSLDSYGEEEAGAKPAVAISPLGTIARPLDADQANDGSPELASEVLMMTVGNEVHALALNDPRVTSKLPPVRKGGYLNYCPAQPGSFWIWDGKQDDPKSTIRPGSFTLSARYGEKAHLIQFDVREDGKEAVSIKHAEGMGLQMTSGGKRSAVFRNAPGNAYVEVNDDGIILAGKIRQQGSMTVGQMAAADSVPKMKALAGYLAVLEGKLATLGQSVPTPFATLMEAIGTGNFKAS